ncbi:hypothetical protein WICPIJ_007634 [Wickerhamomyces pijperi]|uniref:Uncharacterized protein n=1 Tax=Wickerhamomyces pijperi TaxID=599730 RepID=A0A9P8Q1B9_WICPI|nr:hypothetical protein WICPIJ_007634 [Wickerhamomyces pijperi]
MSAELDYPKYGNLTPAFLLHVDCNEPYSVLNNNAGSVVLAKIVGGYTKTINPNTPFDAEVIDGWDKLTSNTAEPSQLSHQNCVLFLKSKKNGKGIVINYTGVIDPTSNHGKVISGELRSVKPDETYLTSTLNYELDSDATDEAWLSTKLTVGKGRPLRDENGVLAFEYVIYTLD